MRPAPRATPPEQSRSMAPAGGPARASAAVRIRPVLMVLAGATVLGCSDPASSSPRGADQPGQASAEAEPDPASAPRESGSSPPAVAMPACLDGASVREALLGAQMQRCADAWDEARYRQVPLGGEPSFEPDDLAFEWTEEERGNARTSCEPWARALTSLSIPDCADHAGDVPGPELVALNQAMQVMQVGHQDPALRGELVSTLLSGAQACLALGRGNSPGMLLGLAGHFVSVADDWMGPGDSTSASRRSALSERFPTPRHRWAVQKRRMQDTLERGIDAPPGIDAAAVELYRAAAREATEALLAVECDDDWDACLGAIDAVETKFTEAWDPDTARRVGRLPSGTDVDALDPEARDALRTQIGISFVGAIRSGMRLEAKALEALQTPAPAGER